jgi:hypothetical protein
MEKRLTHGTLFRLAQLLACSGVPVVPSIALPQSFPLSGSDLVVSEIRTIVHGLPLGLPIDGRIRPDGSVCIDEYSFVRVGCFSPEGKLLWQSGRKGEGPGEFELPYRLSIDPMGRIDVYDMGTRQITRLDPNGRYVARHGIELGLSQVNSLVSIDDSMFFIAGYAPGAGVAGDSAVHRFNKAFSHVASFAPLPAAKDATVLAYWGSGSITQWGEKLVYLRRIPYEIYLFDRSGRHITHYLIPAAVSATVDEAFVIEKQLSSRSVRPSPHAFVAPGIAFPVSNDLLLVVRMEVVSGKATRQWWDLISSQGRLLGSTLIPRPLSGASLLGTSPDARFIWLAGEDSTGEPAIWRLSLKNAHP